MVFKLMCQGKEITKYVISYDWSGALEQAGRKLNFSLATNPYDQNFISADVKLGDTVELYGDDTLLFTGRVFLMDRKTDSYTYEYVAYDSLIYAAKSKLHQKFDNSSVKNVIAYVAGQYGLSIKSLHSDCDKPVSFIADAMTGTEIIKKALELLSEQTGIKYHIVYIQSQIMVIPETETIDTYNITAGQNLISASHSASLEDMINRVIITDKDGNKIGEVSNSDDLQYGEIQDFYKVDEKRDSTAAAKAMLKSVKENTSVQAIGNIQCISGYSVYLQVEDIKARFRIVSDSHKISNNVHTMDLTLDFKEVIQ